MKFNIALMLFTKHRGSNGNTSNHPWARRLGFSIDECRTLLSLYEDQNRASAEVKSIAQKHLMEIEAKLNELQNLQQILSHLIEHCAGDQRPDCPIIDDLSGGHAGMAKEARKLH